MQIISTYSVIGSIAYLMTKRLTIDINKLCSWYILYIKLPESSVQQLIFCKECIWDVNVKHCSTDESCLSIVYNDASDIGFGGYIVETLITIVHGMWIDVELGNICIVQKSTSTPGKLQLISIVKFG
jgi:hypothetical protein